MMGAEPSTTPKADMTLPVAACVALTALFSTIALIVILFVLGAVAGAGCATVLQRHRHT